MVGCDAVEFDVHEYMRYVRCIWSFISIPMQIFEVGIEELPDSTLESEMQTHVMN